MVDEARGMGRSVTCRIGSSERHSSDDRPASVGDLPYRQLRNPPAPTDRPASK